MADIYDPKKIEKKWQETWEKEGIYKTLDQVKGKDNFYTLVEFAYPSGNLHVGHWYAFAVPDIYARYQRMTGKNVLYPIGFDSFGLPAENAAIKRGLDPAKWTYENIDYMKGQIRSMGAMFDWDRAIATSDPEYYKWTQMMFTKFFENDLVYRATTKVNWCPKDQTILANEQVVNGRCDRCDTEVQQRDQDQWSFRITKYADRLCDDLDALDWPQAIKDSQKNWIGRTEGAEIDFKVAKKDHKIRVFTTRPETICGATFIAVSAGLAKSWLSDQWRAGDEVIDYIEETLKEQAVRDFKEKEKTGIYAGFSAINPATKEEIPVWITNYVLDGVGTGAIMAVPQSDDRDREFAEKFNLPIGVYKETDEVFGEKKVNYRLRDWGISRQRYWGVPIPIVYDSDGKAHPVPSEHLPWLLPEDVDHTPDGTAPLARSKELFARTQKIFGAGWRPEVETMDTFVDSSWYFYRYLDPKNSDDFCSREKQENWMPINMYFGGAEHTTMHLLYSRFWNKALYDLGMVKDSEPYSMRRNRGLILGPDGNKMSKSKGNVIDPDEVVSRVGTDTVRMYLAFMGPYGVTDNYPWDPNGVVGIKRFLERVWNLKNRIATSESNTSIHKTIKKVAGDIERLKFNTAISSMMILVNDIESVGVSSDDYKKFLQILAPFAPHMTEELWREFGEKESIHLSTWPEYDESKIRDEKIKIMIQINGKIRDEIMIDNGADEEEVKKLALSQPKVVEKLVGAEPKNIIYIAGRLVNIVI